MGITNNKYHFGFVRNGMEAGEWIKCRSNPIYFMKTYIKIPTTERGLIPFGLFLFQTYLIQTFTQHRNTIVLKPRQMGITTLVCAFVLWLCLFHGYKRVVLISIKYSLAREMLKKIRDMYRHLPNFLKEPITNGATAEDVGTSNRVDFANGSTITAVASSEDAARSEAASLVIIDEGAFIQQASGIWAAVRPAIATGGSSIVLSTAFGMGTWFHQSWVNAITGTNKMYPVKLNWRMRPDYDDRWYAEMRADLGFKRTMQEIDCDFLQSGMNVLNMAKVKIVEQRVNNNPPIFKEQVGFEGYVLQYFGYDHTKQYTIGADISTGRSNDFSTFSIYDNTGKEVCCYKGKILPREFAHLLMKWGYKYGKAMLAPEINSIGEGVMSVLQEHWYDNIYNDVSNVLKLGEWEHRQSDYMGWLTTGKSRHEMITGFDEDLEMDLIEPCNPYFVQEATTFIYDSQNRPVARGKGRSASKSAEFYEESTQSYTDDAIFGECIANAVRKSPLRFKQGLQPIIIGGYS